MYCKWWFKVFIMYYGSAILLSHLEAIVSLWSICFLFWLLTWLRHFHSNYWKLFFMFLLYLWQRLKPEKVSCLVSINISYPIIGFIQTTWLPWISQYIKSLVCFQSRLWDFQTVFRQRIISSLYPSVISELNRLHKWLKSQPRLLNSELSYLADVFPLTPDACYAESNISCW